MRKLRIMSINMNDFGGKKRHLMEHKYFSNRDREKHIDWLYWAKYVDKSETWEAFKRYILQKNPDILFLEEMLISCYEEIDFLGELKKLGYIYVDESLPERGNYSLTMSFYKGEEPEYVESPGNYRRYRSVICRIADMLVYGSHFPSESDEEFLAYTDAFIRANLSRDILLIGDLNANNPERGNRKMLNRLLEDGAVDLWTAAGNPEDTPTEAKYRKRIDYAIASPSLAEKVRNIEIDSFPMESGMTDHAAVIVDIEIEENELQENN